MSSKSDFSYFSLIFDDKKVIESTNIKRRDLEIVHQKETSLDKTFLTIVLYSILLFIFSINFSKFI